MAPSTPDTAITAQLDRPLQPPEIGDLLNDLAFGFAVLGDPRRPSAYRNGARVIKKLGPDLPRLLASGELAKTRGIGKSIVAVVEQGLSGAPIEVMAKLAAQLPVGLLAARKIRGLGPGRVKALWQRLGLTSLAEIEYACTENRLVELPGFSAATQDSILSAIHEVRDRDGKLRVDQAWAAANDARRVLLEAGAERVEPVGQLARACPVVTELALAVLAPVGFVVPEIGGITLHVGLDPARFGALLACTMAADAHLAQLREKAGSMGFSLDPDGLRRGAAWVVTHEVRDVYHALALHLPAPERREGHVPLRGLDEPEEALVRLADLQGALHNHTTESDGLHDLWAMRDAAAALGLSYLGITEHSQTAMYAGGLSPERLAEQRQQIAVANTEGHACTVLSGVESDILREGALDYGEEQLDGLDVVVASVHNRFSQGHEAMTARMVAAARARVGDVLGHPTGRLLLGRPAAECDMAAVLDACAESGMAVELNANPQRLDLSVPHLRMAKARGLKVSIAADAHSTQGLRHLRHGVRHARRAGLTRDDVLNCLSLPELQEWIAARRR